MPTPASYRFPADLTAPPPTWVDLIREANGVEPGTFAAPTSTGDWWAGGYVEEYEHARVLHRTDGSVSVAATTDTGARVLAAAAARLGVHGGG